MQKSFDPRPREGGDTPLPCWSGRGRSVSIHAPAREATSVSALGALWLWSFDPRPREGGDRPSRSSTTHRFQCFDPRPREGGDRRLKPKVREDFVVSIHAPAREATSTVTYLQRYTLFRSTPPRGRRRCCNLQRSVRRSFDPRPREGGDTVIEVALAHTWCFDPRPREGGDGLTVNHRFLSGNSPHSAHHML